MVMGSQNYYLKLVLCFNIGYICDIIQWAHCGNYYKKQCLRIQFYEKLTFKKCCMHLKMYISFQPNYKTFLIDSRISGDSNVWYSQPVVT